MKFRQSLFILAAWALAASAHASYAQMRLDGLGLSLAFLLVVGYVLIVDFVLALRLFRYRAAVVVALVLALAVIFLFIGAAASPVERAGFSKMASGGLGRVLLAVTGVVLLPFIVIAPIAQYVSMRDERRWPRWIGAWMGLQLALLPVFIVLGFTDAHFRQREYEAGQAEGRQAKAGELGALLERAAQRRERIWGTGWTYPWAQQPPAQSQSYDTLSAWTYGVAAGVNASALIATVEPLSPHDSAALSTLMQQHFLLLAVPNIRAKLLWDALEPGRFSAKLAPTLASEESIPVLLERLEKHGEARLCPGGRMTARDRAALNGLLTANNREMRPPWDDYQRRLDRLCPGPA